MTSKSKVGGGAVGLMKLKVEWDGAKQRKDIKPGIGRAVGLMMTVVMVNIMQTLVKQLSGSTRIRWEESMS